MDEWQISLDYVRGSNIYVRGYLDLRAWSLRLRTKTEEDHYVKVLFPSRRRCFSLRWIRRILAIGRRACMTISESCIRSAVLKISRLYLDMGAVRWVEKGTKGRI